MALDGSGLDRVGDIRRFLDAAMDGDSTAARWELTPLQGIVVC